MAGEELETEVKNLPLRWSDHGKVSSRVVPLDNDPNDSCGRWYSIVPHER